MDLLGVPVNLKPGRGSRNESRGPEAGRLEVIQYVCSFLEKTPVNLDSHTNAPFSTSRSSARTGHYKLSGRSTRTDVLFETKALDKSIKNLSAMVSERKKQRPRGLASLNRFHFHAASEKSLRSSITSPGEQHFYEISEGRGYWMLYSKGVVIAIFGQVDVIPRNRRLASRRPGMNSLVRDTDYAGL
jgi:hypothetical protein